MAVAEQIINEQNALTVAIKACCACSGQLFEHDRFCRRCGQSQPDASSRALRAIPESSRLEVPSQPPAARYATSPLAGTKSNLYHRVSGPLVDAVINTVANGQLSEQSRWLRQAMLALISLPIWLMIVLLSPLDAYAAAKNLLKENQ